MANFALWLNIIITSVVVIIVIIGVRNSVRSSKDNEALLKKGQEVPALIVAASQHKVQNADGVLTLEITVEFEVNNNSRRVKRDITVQTFHADEYKSGKEIKIKYNKENPDEIVILGNAKN